MPEALLRHTAVFLCVLLLSLVTVFNQVKALGLSWHEQHYVARLQAVANGNADAPAQYRVLSDLPTLWLCQSAEKLGIPRPLGSTLVLIRIAQNAAIFLGALVLYRRLGIPTHLGLLGISALAWGMTQSNHNSDLAVNTYSDVLLYLLAGYAVVSERMRWLIPLAVLGSLNRETSCLIPLVAVAAVHTAEQDRWRSVAAYSAAAWLVTSAALRVWFGVRPWTIPPDVEALGGPLLWHNLTNERTYAHLAGTLGVIPIIALAGWRLWTPALHAFFWALVPAWFAFLPFVATVVETRLVLVPQALVFIPAALCVMQREPRT